MRAYLRRFRSYSKDRKSVHCVKVLSKLTYVLCEHVEMPVVLGFEFEVLRRCGNRNYVYHCVFRLFVFVLVIDLFRVILKFNQLSWQTSGHSNRSLNSRI